MQKMARKSLNRLVVSISKVQCPSYETGDINNSCYVRKCTNVVFFGIDNSLLFTKVPTVYECVYVCVCVCT